VNTPADDEQLDLTGPRKAERAGAWLWANFAQLATVGGGALATGSGLADGGWKLSMGLGGLVLGLAGGVSALRQRPTYPTLLKHSEDLQETVVKHQQWLSELVRSLLRSIHVELGLTNDGRVCIYRHEPTRGQFSLMARYAENPDFDKTGRGLYPEGQGVIGQAWTKGEVTVTDLPGDSSAYEARLASDFGMSSDVARNLTMQSRSLYGLRYPSSSSGTTPLGVVVLESLSPRGVNGTVASRLKSLPTWQTLESYLDSQRAIVPMVSDAQKMGF
jgi:hypothetical protein